MGLSVRRRLVCLWGRSLKARVVSLQERGLRAGVAATLTRPDWDRGWLANSRTGVRGSGDGHGLQGCAHPLHHVEHGGVGAGSKTGLSLEVGLKSELPLLLCPLVLKECVNQCRTGC